MFNFFRKSHDSKKVPLPEIEADGFVLVGDTINEQRRASKDKSSFPETGPTYNQPVQLDPSKQGLSGTYVPTVTTVSEFLGQMHNVVTIGEDSVNYGWDVRKQTFLKFDNG
ncbi:unnamed protein product [Lepidochelys olivacea]